MCQVSSSLVVARPAAIDELLNYLTWRMGVTFAGRERSTVERSLWAVAVRFGFSSLGEMWSAIIESRSKDLDRALMDAVAVNYTYFYREPSVLDYWANSVVPTIVSGERNIRIWSAACSTGQEPYTIAMILEARLGLVDFKRRVRVLATDIHTGVLCTAERGRYPENALRSVPEAWKGKYFERSSDGAAQVAAALRAACMFRRLNLHSRPYPMRGRFDTVFCRNVLYYFDPLERIEILKAIHEVVQPNGWLVTSVTEPIGRITGLWHEVAPGVYSRISPAH